MPGAAEVIFSIDDDQIVITTASKLDRRAHPAETSADDDCIVDFVGFGHHLTRFCAVEELAASDGGRVVRPRMTKVPILEQGVDAVFDCVGYPDTIDLALHILRPGGMLVLVGAAGKQSVDWSLVWSRELTVQGTINSGPEPALGGRRTMEQVAEWLADPAYLVDGLVTHTYSLDEWQQGLTTASAGPKDQAVKVTLRPNADLPLL